MFKLNIHDWRTSQEKSNTTVFEFGSLTDAKSAAMKIIEDALESEQERLAVSSFKHPDFIKGYAAERVHSSPRRGGQVWTMTITKV